MGVAGLEFEVAGFFSSPVFSWALTSTAVSAGGWFLWFFESQSQLRISPCELRGRFLSNFSVNYGFATRAKLAWRNRL
jgi:hypothetical protein